MVKNFHFRYFVTVHLVALMLMLQGCGGGGSTPPASTVSDDNTSTSTSTDTTNNTTSEDKFKYNRVVIAGSSITHGNIEDISNNGEGYLGELSYVGEVENYFRESLADTIGPNELLDADDSYSELMSYQGVIKVYQAGSELQGTLEASDEIAIVYAGSNESTEVTLEVDGQTYDYKIPAGAYTPVKKVFDDTNVVFYKAFRENDPKAVKIWKLDSNNVHTFKLKVKSGELHLNFITNHMYYFQNAGVGGYEAVNFLNTSREHSNLKDIITFDPDVFILESSTNDAKTWAKEIQLKANPNVDAASTNVWIIENPVAFTASGKLITLNQNVNVQKGDVVIMGEYNGDIQNMVVGIVANNANAKTIALSKIVSYAGQKVTELDSVPVDIIHQCTIKNIAHWENSVKEIVQNLESGVGHDVLVGIGTSGVPNYYKPQSGVAFSQPPYTPRRLLGYREKGQMLAQENGWLFVDFFQNTLKVESGVDENHKWSYGDNTHTNEPGRGIFGQAVINALQ